MIRPARAGDAEALAPLLDQLGYPFAGAEVARALGELLRDPAHLVLVAEEDGRVVGFASSGATRDDGEPPRTGELYTIYVLPERWGTGSGRDLMRAAVGRLRGRGFERALLWVLEDNPRARRFYERAGWAADGARKAEERFGVRAPEVRYRKHFRE